jgi:hypothetical protein
MGNRLTELAERCEKALVPDRELDAEIYNAAPEANRKAERLPMEKWGDRFDDGWRTMWADREDKYPEKLKRYTASLDAAMTLVPEGWLPLLDSTDAEAGRHYVELFPLPEKPIAKSCAGTLPLALCAAALKARATMEEE